MTDTTYHHLNASPFPSAVCMACGCDPCLVRAAEHPYQPMGFDPSRAIERRGQLCRECAEESAAYLISFYTVFTWRPK
jgi:hypothetical protein